MLELSNISKKYGVTKALDDVSLTINEGKVTSIYGPNGAGKSTLVKIICGEEKQDFGVLKFNKKIINFRDYQEAQKNGISYVPQDFGLLKNLTVLENIAITQNVLLHQLLFSKRQIQNVINSAKPKNLPIPELEIKVENLSAYEQQLLATLRALLFNPVLIIFDESTTNLNLNDFRRFKEVIHNLKENGRTIIFISHKLNEVFEISDNIVILNQGRVVSHSKIDNVSQKDIIQYFVSKKLTKENIFKTEKNKLCSVIIDHSQITIGRGEVIAIDSGDTSYNQEIGYKIFEKLNEIRNLSVGIIPALREEEAIFPNLSVRDNLILAAAKFFSNEEKQKLKNKVNEIAKELKITFENWNQSINELSGGNKQKVVLARWIISDFDILVLIEPTSGLDIETKEIIHNRILDMKNEGKSFILISSDEGEQKMLKSRTIRLSKKTEEIC